VTDGSDTPSQTASSPSPLRVLIVCQYDLAGASEKQALWFGRELVRTGHLVLMSLYGDPESAGREAADGVEGLRLHFHRFRGRTVRSADLRVAGEFAPTAVHAFSARVPVATAARAYARATGAPYFVHWEDDEFGIRTRVNTPSFARRIASHGRSLARAFYPPAGPYVTRATLQWARGAAGHDALTPALADWVQEQLGRPCEVVLPIAPHVWEPLPAPSDTLRDLASRRVLMITGAIHGGSVPDIETALQATALVRQRGHDAVFVHAGTVVARFDLDAMVRDAGLAPAHARFLGPLPFPAIPPLLREADVLLQPGAPSTFNRLRLPSKLQAYLASGVPTVTFAIGFGEMLEDRMEVLKVSTAAAEELTDAIAAILDDDVLRQRLAEGGRRAAQRLFDPGANGAALVAYFRAGMERAAAATASTTAGARRE